MSDGVDIETCNDEELLTKILAKEDNMDRRRKLRLRLKEIRDQEKKLREERKKARDQEGNVDSVRTRAQQAEAEKARKLKAFEEQAKSSAQSSVKTDAVKAMAERAEAEKAGKMKAFEEQAKAGGPVAFQGGFDAAKRLDQEHAEASKQRALQSFSNQQKLQHAAAQPEVAVPKVQKKAGVAGVSYGTRTGQKNATRGAMNAFKAMDKSANPDGPKKPNFMSNPAPARGGVTRNPSAIKQMLLEWCKAQVQGYEGVNVTNFGSSWADGLAFCALIHHFHPEAFDFSTLNAKNRRENFQLAFDSAEKYADIAPLLDVEDMVMMKVPDWKCVFCYVQSYYRKFRDHEKNVLRSQEPNQAKAEE